MAKFDGVDEIEARRRTLPSPTSMMGIVKHLTGVEEWWFRYNFAGLDVDPGPDDDSDFDISDDQTVADLLEAYRQSCEASRAAVAGAEPDDMARREPPRGPTNLRWIMIHMIEEIARHAGHLDILREQIDGVVGE